MIPAKYLHKKVTSWRPISEWAELLGGSIEEVRDAAMENTDVGYINLQGEFIGPAFDFSTGPFALRARLEPPFKISLWQKPA